ncbi:methyltransferase domain-containing protein [Acetobacter conturbans]|uniref:Methyltransferase domain-containing protein n=1 Tax=Acetobacter conturbans TaxID=1737472 RepID=A0ABX0JYB6_9PROT|nr:methyltransferase domain-containing protein [Acetobacter conturbans]NHN87561.1 methyltransferase domain-containing protein [Acetobacter conturbans]
MILEATGERFMPDMQGETAIEHMHRYLFARELVPEGSTVLDVACGEGYGSALLSAKAENVTGVDVSPAAVEHAQEKYGNDRVRFLAGDICALPLPDKSVDAIVSFETIEHVADHEKMLSEFIRVLKPAGIVIISSPDKYQYSVATGYSNEFHVKELFSHEFEALMKSRFRNVVFGGQRNLFGSVIDFAGNPSRDVSFSLAEGGVARFEDVPQAMYLLAVASQEALPEVVRGVCIDHVTSSDAFRDIGHQMLEKDDAFQKQEERHQSAVSSLEAELAEKAALAGKNDILRGHVTTLEGELDREKVRVIELSRQLFEEREKNTALLKDVSRLHQDVANMMNLCGEREQRISVLSGQNAELSHRVENLRDFENRYTLIENSTAWRMTKPMRNVIDKLPAVKGAARRIRHRKVGTGDASGSSNTPNPEGETRSEGQAPPSVPSVVLDEETRQFISDIAPLFNVPYYVEQVGEAGAGFDARSAAEHYLLEGCKAGLNPCPDFDTNYYLSRHQDVLECGMNPFCHWALHGRRERRLTLPYASRLLRTARRPLVSAIITNFNHARFLEDRFESILNQTYRNIEILFLDDASEDDSLDVAKRYAEKYPEKIRIIPNASNSGNVFRQWRKGVDEAKGEIVWICESDDFAEERFVEELIHAFVDPSVEIAFGRIQFCDVDGRMLDGLDGYRERAQAGIWGEAFVKPAGWWFQNAFAVSNVIANVSGCLIRRHFVRDEVWEQAQTFRVLGDWYLYAEWVAGGQIAYSPRAVSYFRQHDKNTSVNSFRTVGFYQEHQRMIEHLRRKWGVDEEHVRRFASALNDTFRHVRAEEVLGSFEAVFDIEQVLATPHEQQHILFAVLGFELGGGEIFPIELANSLVRKGAMVSFLVYDHHREDPQIRALLDSSVPVYSADVAREIGVWRYVMDLHADVIHSHFCFCETLFFPDDETLPLLPYIVTLHGSYECVRFPPDVVERLRRGVALWVYLAEKNLFHLRGRKDELPCGDVAFIGNGMAVDKRPFPMDRKALGIGPQDFVLAVASRCIPEKGWKQACEAVLTLNEETGAPRKMHLLLCGSGDALEGLQARYGTTSNIHFLGYQECISGLYRLADCMLLPTRFPGESFPLTLIQALQVGTPAIATDVGFVRPMMTGEAGDLAGLFLPLEAEDATFEAAIVTAVREMMDEGKRAAFARTARTCGARYDIANVADTYIRTYQRFRSDDRLMLPSSSAGCLEAAE